MENTITMFFLICYVIFVVVLMRFIKGKSNALTRRIMLSLFALIPVADSIASEVLYFAAKRSNTSSIVYKTAAVSEFAIIGEPCNVRKLDTTSFSSFVNKKGFNVKIFPSYSLDKSSDINMLKEAENMIANRTEHVRYVVLSRGINVFNVTFRNKIIYDNQKNIILGESHDVSITRYFPFFTMLFKPSNRRVQTFPGSDFCDFEYQIFNLDAR